MIPSLIRPLRYSDLRIQGRPLLTMLCSAGTFNKKEGSTSLNARTEGTHPNRLTQRNVMVKVWF